MYETIKNILRYKDHVLIKNEQGNYLIISSIKDCNGNLKNSTWWYTIKEAKQNIGQRDGYTQKEIQEFSNNHKIIDAWDNPKEMFKMVDKVLILPNAKKECEKYGMDWNDKKEERIGKVCEVKRFIPSYCQIGNEDESDWWIFPPTCLSYPFNEEKIEITLDEIATKFNIDVKNLKIKK